MVNRYHDKKAIKFPTVSEIAMAETKDATPKVKRERSPSFPFIPLQVAIKRLLEFEATFGRHPAPAKHTGSAWGMKGWSSQAQQTLAALKSYGLVDYTGSADELTASISDEARIYLRAQQDSIKAEILKTVALKPKAVAKYFAEWGPDRPIDAVCLDRLVLKDGFTDSAAKLFLSVYDSTIAYAGLSDADKEVSESGLESDEEPDLETEVLPPPPPMEKHDSSRRQPPAKPITYVEQGERELVTGILSKSATFRVIVSGHVGEREIDRLIKKLEFDKEILADPDEGTVPTD